MASALSTMYIKFQRHTGIMHDIYIYTVYLFMSAMLQRIKMLYIYIYGISRLLFLECREVPAFLRPQGEADGDAGAHHLELLTALHLIALLFTMSFKSS